MDKNKDALDALDRLYSQPNGYNENKAADDHNLIYDALQTQAELVEALRECVNQLETNDMYGHKVYQRLTNERRNMLTAAKVMGKKALARAEGKE